MRAGLNARRLVEAGADIADGIGFERLTLSTVARHFDVQVASLYSHVRSSQDLRTRITLLALEEMAGRAAEAVAGRARKDALVALANVHRDYAREHPGRYAAAILPLDHSTAIGSAGPRLAEATRSILRGYDLAEPDQTHAVRMLGSLFRGFVDLERAGSFSHSEPDAQQSWYRSIDAMDALLRNWPATE